MTRHPASQRSAGRSQTLVAALVLSLGAGTLAAQTPITPPKNKYTPEQDVQIGREAANEVRQQYPVINDSEVQEYLDDLGQRLVAATPPQYRQPAFEYSFTPVNLKDINAFALPGGPMFVNRGMIDAASREGEVAGVMAHELSHVLLRHGTANATKAQGAQIGAIAGAIAGAIVGGGWGQVISQGSQFGLGTWLMKYSREYEKQADLLGAQIMARAGYDPRDLARMFETIQAQAKGSGGPEWMSSHPNPGNRSTYIAQEAAQLRIAAPPNSQAAFTNVKRELSQLPAARSMADLARGNGGGGGNAPASVGQIGQPVPAPSNSYRTVRGGQLFQAAVPSNWQAVTSNSAVKFVPQNAYGQLNGETVFTHGVELGVARAASTNLSESTDALLNALAQGNPNLRHASQPRRAQLSQRNAIENQLVNRTPDGGQERVGLITTFLSDGNLFYMLTIVPDDEAGRYEPAFDRVASTVRLNDR
jgi:Zn-dependent protease with chaperone function